jgi:hypothetical protein
MSVGYLLLHVDTAERVGGTARPSSGGGEPRRHLQAVGYHHLLDHGALLRLQALFLGMSGDANGISGGTYHHDEITGTMRYPKYERGVGNNLHDRSLGYFSGRQRLGDEGPCRAEGFPGPLETMERE